MSIFDKVIAVVTPQESAKARADARATAAAFAEPGDWLSLVLDHHIELEDALGLVESSATANERADAFKDFAILLTGHSIAEEAVLYPGLSADTDAGNADIGYSEQAVVKMRMAALERLDPLSQEFEQKLEHVKGALLHHMYEEEGNWFLEMKKNTSPEDQDLMTSRYAEEFDRYVGGPDGSLEDENAIGD